MSVISAPDAVPVTSAGSETALRVAGTDRRFYAFALDRLLAGGIELAVAVVARHYLVGRGHAVEGVLLVLVTVLAVDGLLALMLGSTGCTPGRWCCGLRVIDVRTRRPIGARPALLRAMVVGGATVPCGFGLAALAWTALADPEHLGRGWHDRQVSSIVVDIRSLPGVEEPEDAAPGAVVNLTAMRLVPARRTPSGAALTSVAAGTLVHGGARPLAARTAPAAWGLVFDTGDRVRVDTSVLVGRRPEPREGERATRLVGLPSADLSVSHTHAHVVVTPDGTLVITDLGSTNGSVLTRRGAGRALTPGRPATMLAGDVVHLGDRTMTVVRLS